MPITVQEFLEVLERLAPASLAEEWDNCGLQVGAREAGSSAVLVSLNVTDEVINEAAELDCDVILTHHPLIFTPLESLSDDTGAGRLARRAAMEGISVVAAHTNLDAAPGGLADIMAGMLGLTDVEPVAAPGRAKAYKLVVFVPANDLERVRRSLFEAGAGVIGDYRHCSWFTAGTGTFMPEEGASPTVGKVGSDESVEEFRLETLVEGGLLDGAVAAMVAAHSYEEPAYDIYPLTMRVEGAPAGRVGQLPVPVTVRELAGRIASLFGLDEARYMATIEHPVARVAVVPGSGSSFIDALRGVADLLVTGDIKYHDADRAQEAGIGLIELPHDVSESVTLELWSRTLGKEIEPRGLVVHVSRSAISAWETSGREEGIIEREAGTADSGSYRLHVDGGARGNPGPAGIGAVMLDADGDTVFELSETIGEATNNVAEYRALLAGLMRAIERGVSSLDIYSDSELVVKQLRGEYKVRNEGLRPLHDEAIALLRRLDHYRLHAVPRERNAHADMLVNKALDGET